MNGKPQNAAEKLLNDLNALDVHSPGAEFALAGLEKRARALISKSAAQSWVALGAIATLRGDAESMRAYHRKALAAAPGDSTVAANFATSLSRLALYGEAADAIVDACRLEPTNLTYLERLVEFSLNAGRISAAREALAMWARVSPERPHKLQQIVLELDRLMLSKGISEADIARLLKLAIDVLDQNKVRKVTVSHCLQADESSDLFIYEIVVAEPPTSISRLRRQLAQAVAESEIDPVAIATFCVTYSGSDVEVARIA